MRSKSRRIRNQVAPANKVFLFVLDHLSVRKSRQIDIGLLCIWKNFKEFAWFVVCKDFIFYLTSGLYYIVNNQRIFE